jgi:hypothetical protein
LIALALLANAAHEKSNQVLRGPGGPTRSDVALGAAGLRELFAWIPGPSLRDTPLVGTLVIIAVAGTMLRPGLSRTAHGIRTTSRRARYLFNHRYGHKGFKSSPILFDDPRHTGVDGPLIPVVAA